MNDFKCIICTKKKKESIIIGMGDTNLCEFEKVQKTLAAASSCAPSALRSNVRKHIYSVRPRLIMTQK